MSAKYDKNTIFYIVRETGQDDQVFMNKPDALTAYLEPLLGPEKVVIKAEVVSKRIQVVQETEL